MDWMYPPFRNVCYDFIVEGKGGYVFIKRGSVFVRSGHRRPLTLDLGVVASFRKLRAPEAGRGYAKFGREYPGEVMHGLESAADGNLLDLPLRMEEHMLCLLHALFLYIMDKGLMAVFAKQPG